MGLEAIALPLALAVGALGASQLACAALGSSDREFGLGARITLGVALLAVPAGGLVAAGAYSRGAALVLLGLAGLGLLAPLRRSALTPTPAPTRLRAPDGIAVAVLAGVALARTLGALRFPHYNPCDDWIAYLHFPRLLLESGGFEEPFGMRRLGVLGAGPFVQGFFWPSFGINANALADAVFGQLAVIGGAFALCEACAPARSVAVRAGFALAALLATLTIPYLNTLPLLLPYGAALLLLALHARLVLRAPDAATTRDAALFGALAALLIGLRVSNALVPAALWALALAHAAWRRDRARLRLAAIAALATAVALLPWCISLWRSSGTPLFPLVMGNYRFPSVFTEPLSPRQLASFVAECLLANRALVVVAVAALAFTLRKRRVLAVQLAVTALAFVVVTALGVSAFDSHTVLRYCAPLVVPLLLALVALVAFVQHAPRRRWPQPALASLMAVWLLVPVTTHSVFDEKTFSLLEFAARDAREWQSALAKFAAAPLELEAFEGAEAYLEAQRLLPPGARVVAAAEQAYLWRRDLHTIHGLDCLGQASPDPGMPFFAGAEAMAGYFTSLGYTHLAFTPPRRGLCLYSSAHWLSHRNAGQWMWRQWAPYFLDFMQTQRELARTRAVVYRSSHLVVLDLRRKIERVPRR